MRCKLKSRDNKIFLSLKLKSTNKWIINIGIFRANKNNTIHILMENKKSIWKIYEYSFLRNIYK